MALLLLGQVALAWHLAKHPFVESQKQQETSCSICITGGHMAMTAVPPVVTWIRAWDISGVPLPALGNVGPLYLKTLHCRGPPTLPTA
ncbi:MAG: hypothetical protein ACT4NU_01055 [Chromatiales bacterium]